MALTPDLSQLWRRGVVRVLVGDLNFTSLGAPKNTVLEARLGKAVVARARVVDGNTVAPALPPRTGEATLRLSARSLKRGVHVTSWRVTLVARPTGTTVTLGVPFTV